MLTLSYGIKKPETNDRGNVFFPALEANFQKQNDHDHDGSNSAPILARNISKGSNTVLAAAWSATSGGRYRQEVTMPSGYLWASSLIKFTISGGGSDGFEVHLTVEKGSAINKYYVYINDNSLTLLATYV